MNQAMPIIGITAGYDYDKGMSFLKEGYYEAIVQSGGIPIILAATEDEEVLNNYIRLCDGIILSGGPDIDASYFGQSNMPFAEDISPLRDGMEMYIARKVLKLDKPLLGICRGCQTINIAAGGSIFQDIYAENPSENSLIKHRQQAPKWHAIHEISINKDTLLYNIYESTQVRVNSFHHQAVNRVATNFCVDAVSADGIIEAISCPNSRFVLGVQWHPELMWQRAEQQLRLFKYFVGCCK